MSAIGDYIHRSLKGYMAEGEGRPPYFSAAKEAYQKKKDEIKRQIEMEKVDKELEK